MKRAHLLFAAPALLSACESCRHERPYTPFGVTSALPASASASAAPAPSGSAPPLLPGPDTSVKKAVMAPAAARRWSLEGRELDAPAGRYFEQALVSDFDADGTREVAAWTLAEKDTRDALPGELWLYPAQGDPKKLLDYPSFLPTGPDCTSVASLFQSGTRTLTLDVRVTCGSRLVARAPTRALAIVDPVTDGAPRFGVRAAESAPGEILTLNLIARDEDADGREDYRLTTGLGFAEAAPEVSADFLFLDRAAGVSRDGREPVKSLLELLKKDASRATKKKTADTALAHVGAARRLLASLCAEGGTPRVFDWLGNPLHCGGLQDIVDRLASLEVNAWLSLGETGEALGALARDGWYFGAARSKVRTELSNAIEKKLTASAASKIVIGARPRAFRPPSFSPLTFDSTSALLIQTDSGLMRFAPDASREEPVLPEAGIQPWPLEVTLGEQRWLGVSYSCDRSELSLLVIGGNAEPEASKLLAPRPGVCTGGTFREGFAPSPIGTGHGIEALVGGTLVGPKSSDAPHPGAARSANGAYVAVPSPLGLFVRGASSRLFKVDGWSQSAVSGCVVDNLGERAACVRDGKAELYVAATR